MHLAVSTYVFQPPNSFVFRAVLSIAHSFVVGFVPQTGNVFCVYVGCLPIFLTIVKVDLHSSIADSNKFIALPFSQLLALTSQLCLLASVTD